MKHVHIVDDEPHITRITRLALERAGYQVEVSGNGEQALSGLEQCLPDVLVTDIDMPRMSGDQLCQEIDKRWPDRQFPIYVLTSRAEIEHREWISTMHDVSLIEKPVSLRHLLAELESRLMDDDAAKAPASPTLERPAPSSGTPTDDG